MEGLHSRFKSADELEKNRSIEITKAKEQRERRMKKNEEILRETGAKRRDTNMYVMRVQKRREREEEEKIFKEVMVRTSQIF